MAAADTFCSPTVVVPRAGLLCVFCLDLLKAVVFTSHIQHWLGTTEASLVEFTLYRTLSISNNMHHMQLHNSLTGHLYLRL